MEKQVALVSGNTRPATRRLTPAQRKMRARQIRKDALRCIMADIVLGIRRLPDNIYRFVLNMLGRCIILTLLAAGVLLAMGIFFAVLTFWMSIPL